MSASAIQKLQKPQLRGLLRSHLKRHLSIAVVLSISAAAGYKYGVAEPRKKAYAEFYKTYDAEADYQRMKKLGVYPPYPQFD